MKNAILGLAFCAAMPLFAQQKATVTVHPEQGKQIINKEIYGQFAEHLGTCIYGGLWVGEDSSIPNIKGYRKDVFEALKDLKVPVLRWPGGCFADDCTAHGISVPVDIFRQAFHGEIGSQFNRSL